MHFLAALIIQLFELRPYAKELLLASFWKYKSVEADRESLYFIQYSEETTFESREKFCDLLFLEFSAPQFSSRRFSVMRYIYGKKSQ